MLVKFCSAKHIVPNGSELKLGTLYGYRMIENAELRDEHEGKYRITLSFRGEVVFERRVANLLFGNVMQFGELDVDPPRFAGGMSVGIESLGFGMQNGDVVVLRDSVVHIDRWVPDTHILCMSQMHRNSVPPFAGYDSHWGIPEHAADRFAKHVADALLWQAKSDLFVDLDKEFLEDRSKLAILFRHQPIKYMDRNLIIRYKAPSYSEVVDILENIAFIKPKKFSSENEYRFSFVLFGVDEPRRSFKPKADAYLKLNSGRN
jgi:hypothetical protein